MQDSADALPASRRLPITASTPMRPSLTIDSSVIRDDAILYESVTSRWWVPCPGPRRRLGLLDPVEELLARDRADQVGVVLPDVALGELDDLLVGLAPDRLPALAVDLPRHGLSSVRPSGGDCPLRRLEVRCQNVGERRDPDPTLWAPRRRDRREADPRRAARSSGAAPVRLPGRQSPPLHASRGAGRDLVARGVARHARRDRAAAALQAAPGPG